MVKKYFYIFAFTILGILVSFLVYAELEVFAIAFLTADFEKYWLGFSWKAWPQVHGISAVVLFLLGAVFGFWHGRYWWQVLYVEKQIKK